MATWVLILTLVFDGYKAGGASLQTIEGFPSREACLAAGTAWLNSSPKARQVDKGAVCVPKGRWQ